MRAFFACLLLALLVSLFVSQDTSSSATVSPVPVPSSATHLPTSTAQQRGSALGFDLRNYYTKHRHETPNVFLKRFPYGRYLKAVPFTDFTTLQKHRSFLYRKKDIGDAFLYHLADRFYALYPPRQSHLRRFVNIGEAYINPKNKQFHPNDHVNRRLSEIYETIGYFLLGRAAAYLQQEIEAGRWDPETPAHQDVLDRLAESRVYVSYEKSTTQKLLHHARMGNWGYIAKRSWNKVSERVRDFAPNRMRRLLGGRNDGTNKPTATQALALKSLRQYGPSAGGGGHSVHLFRVGRGGNAIGHAVWMRRPNVRSDYLAHRRNGRSVTQRFKQWRNRNKAVLAMSGGFTNSAGQPEGLTVEDGSVVNAVIMPDRDGLVFFGPGGGLRVADLRRRTFTLPLSTRRTTRPLRPLVSMTDYAALVTWCREHEATVFQTQLLAYADSLRIDPAKAPGELRERRILALARAGDGSLSHVVFDLTAQTALADAARQVFDTLRVRGLKVEAILNLDVGAHNILRVYDPNGQRWPAPVGPVSLQRATNLIVYTR